MSLPIGEEVAAGLKVPIVLFEMVLMTYPSLSSSYVETDESKVLTEMIEVEKELRDKGISVTHRITFGIDAAKEIMHVSKEVGTDLIIMSTHGRSGLNRWIMGSETEKVVRSEEVPLLLINASAG